MSRTPLSLEAFLDAYKGGWTLPVLDTVAADFNPTRVSFETLQAEGVTLDAPRTCPDNLVSAEQMPGFVCDLGDSKLRVRCAAYEVVGNYHMKPHLHHVELRRRGIIFEAHDLVELHRATNELFTQEEPFVLEEVSEYDEEFGLGLDALLRYARSLDLEDFATEAVGEIMGKYEWYYWQQTEEWFTNPAKRMAGLGSNVCGPRHAKYLYDRGRPELRAQLAEWLHCTPAEVGAALKADGYDGPLRVFADDELWRQLGVFAAQTQPLSLCPGVAELRKLVLQHYTPLYIANVWMEALVKHWKNLSPQARAHAEGAEVRLCIHNRTRPDPMGTPTMADLKRIRLELAHHLPQRSRPPSRPPLVPVPQLVWEGADRAPESEDGVSQRGDGETDEDEDEDEGEGEDDEGDEVDPNSTAGELSEYTVQQLKAMLKSRQLAISGIKDELIERLLQALAKEAEDEVEASDEEADESDEAELEQLRGVAEQVPRNELVEGRAFFAWNEQARLSFYPLVCMEDVHKGLHKVQVACLEKQDDGSSYMIDPRWQGTTKDDRALNSLIFKVPGESFVEIDGGIDGKRAWSLVMA
jgi:hypothetical protein